MHVFRLPANTLSRNVTRSFADFFIDQRLMESRGATLSRYAVAVVFPVRSWFSRMCT